MKQKNPQGESQQFQTRYISRIDQRDDMESELSSSGDEEASSGQQQQRRDPQKKRKTSQKKLKPHTKRKRNLDSSSDESDVDSDSDDSGRENTREVRNDELNHTQQHARGDQQTSVVNEWIPAKNKEKEYNRKFLKYPKNVYENDNDRQNRRDDDDDDDDDDLLGSNGSKKRKRCSDVIQDDEEEDFESDIETDDEYDVNDMTKCELCKLKISDKTKLPIFVYDPINNRTIVKEKLVHIRYPEIPVENMSEYVKMVKDAISSGSLETSCDSITDYFNKFIVYSINKKYALMKPNIKKSSEEIKYKIEYVKNKGEGITRRDNMTNQLPSQGNVNGVAPPKITTVGKKNVLSNLMSIALSVNSNKKQKMTIVNDENSSMVLDDDTTEETKRMQMIHEIGGNLRDEIYGKKTKNVGYRDIPNVVSNTSVVEEKRKNAQLELENKKKEWSKFCKLLDELDIGTVIQGKIFQDNEEHSFYMNMYKCTTPKTTNFEYMTALKPFRKMKDYQLYTHYDTHDKAELSHARRQRNMINDLINQVGSAGVIIQQNLVTREIKFDTKLSAELRALVKTNMELTDKMRDYGKN